MNWSQLKVYHCDYVMMIITLVIHNVIIALNLINGHTVKVKLNDFLDDLAHIMMRLLFQALFCTRQRNVSFPCQ